MEEACKFEFYGKSTVVIFFLRPSPAPPTLESAYVVAEVTAHFYENILWDCQITNTSHSDIIMTTEDTTSCHTHFAAVIYYFLIN